MIINHNMNAMNAHRLMAGNTANAGKSMEKLSSGLRINRAGDDAAGLAISEKMRGQIRGLDQASRNAQDGISMIQTAEGALNETHSILQRMRELSNQAANGTNTEADRSSMQDEINQLTSEINRIGNTTEFNTQKILNGGMNSNSGSKITEAGAAEKVLGGSAALATGATKTMTNAATTASVTASTKATSGAMTAAAGAVAAGTKITVDGIEFNAGGITIGAVDGSADVANATLIKDLTGTDANGNTVKLSDVANVTFASASLTIESKIAGATSSVAVDADTASKLNANTAVAEVKGDGVAVKVGDNVFELGGVAVDVTDDTTKAATITALGNVTVKGGGATKLADLVDIEFDTDGKLKFTTKSGGADVDLELIGKADDNALGYAQATDEGSVSGSGAATATVGSGVSISVDNTTFDLSGLELDTSTSAGLIQSLENVTSGGTKLSDLVDIEVENGKLNFTTKSTGSTSTIEFTGTDASLGIVVADAGEANAVKGTDSTIERAGLEATTALSTTADISIAKDSTFKVYVGSESAVTVNLNNTNIPKVYDTNNADPNVSKAAMESFVKDINASLQEAGLSGKVSASLSKDNKVQFISETGLDIKLEDGANTPMASAMGYNTTSMTTVKNVDQVVGPGAQGSGYTTSFQIGSNKGQTMAMDIKDMRAAALGITGNAGEKGFTKTIGVTDGTTDVKQEAALNVMTKEDATKSIEVLDKAIANVSTERGKLGAMQNRLEHTIANLGTSSENLTAAESRIRDVDMAKEMMQFSKNNILSQAAQAMLAQANQQPQGVLQLLR